MVAAPSDMPVVEIGSKGITPEGLVALKAACLDHGFFFLSNKQPEGGYHINPETISRMWAISKELFDAPPENKLAVDVKTSTNHRGYFSSSGYAEVNVDPEARGKLQDNKEGLFFGSDNLMGPGNRVPAGMEGLLPEIEDYMRQCQRVCTDLMEAVVQTGLMDVDSKTFCKEYLSDPVYMLKLLKYPPFKGNTDAHTDYGAITLLLPGDKGLEIHRPDGSWQPVPVIPDAFVINLGDLLAMWSDNKLKSTIHRVEYTGSAVRWSIPFFMHPTPHSKVACSSGTVDSYDYLMDRFDKSYAYRKQSASQA